MNNRLGNEHAITAGVGLLEFPIDTVRPEDDPRLQVKGVAAHTYARLIVKDSGIGISEHDIDKIFEPYFTSREMGKGTGLGLSVVHGIVTSHDGHISVESNLGRGTTLYVYLPEAEKKASDPLPQRLEELSTGTANILIVDDEPSIVKMQRQNLERMGYQVTAVTSSTEALQTFEASPDAFDLLISDITMPRITGDTLAQ